MQCPILGFKRILQHAYVEITIGYLTKCKYHELCFVGSGY